MLNVYDKFDKPEDLHLYNEKYHILILLSKLKDSPNELTETEKHVLSQNTSIISKSAELSYNYANSVIEDIFPLGEPKIMRSEYAYMYAMFILKDRWIEAEPYIKEYFGWDEYKDYYDIEE